ncbi:MAG: TetR/AcrR family transcriptional regulator [Anaerolineaceae bacterium]|nr:TetR/AcrR family transcriptional regulator [Anaerolineaceae bacterium]
MDRRIQKTKDAILEAFIELMAEKDFEQLTINEIAERANVNRGTVYLHYADKYDLLDQCIETHVNQLVQSCSPEANSADFSSKTSVLRNFEYLEQHAFFYSTMLTNKGIPAFRNQLLTMALQSFRGAIDMSGINQNMNKEVLVQFMASAVVGVLEWWIMHSMPYPAKDMVEQFWILLERLQMVPQSEVTGGVSMDSKLIAR